MIDLTQFCGEDETRPYLKTPFSFGDFTYATDGRIMVRVARRPDVPEIKLAKEVKWNAPFEGLETAQFSNLPHGDLPPMPAQAEEECGCYEGKVHECPECECVCDMCDGTGIVKSHAPISTTIRGGIFNLRYALMMLALPEVEVMANHGPFTESPAKACPPLLFKFNGGVGALMPRTREDTEHVEIETEKVAA